MKYFLILSSILFFVACEKHPFTPPDGTVSIFYKNANGAYLFTNSTNGYNESAVKIFKIENGITTKFDSGYHYFFPASNVTSNRRLYCYFMETNTSVNAYNTIVLQLKPNINDTLRYLGKRSDGWHYDSIWYNGVLQSSNLFDVVK